MKSLVLILISFLLFLFGGNKHKNDLEKENLRGKVKRVITVGYSVNTVQEQIQKDTVYYKFVDDYDSLGNRIGWKNCKNKDTTICKEILKYDDAKNVTELLRYYKNRVEEKATFKYDNVGNRIEERWYDTNNLMDRRNVYKYDNSGNQIKWSEYAGHANDEKGKDIRFDPDGALMHVYTNKYDNKGNIISQEGNYPDGSFYVKYTYKNDDKGNRTEYSDLSSKGTLRDNRIYQYFNFDNHDNWQKEIYTNNGKPIVIIERQIEYYP